MKLSAAYIPPHQPQHLKADFCHMREIGCTDVLFAVQENHFQWLDGAIRFGPRIAKDQGLTPSLVLWGYANVSGGGRSSRVMLENPDLWRRAPDGQPFGGGFPHPQACYNHPGTLRFFRDYIEIARANGFEGVMIDEPVRQTCFCGHCQEKFGGDLAGKTGTPEYEDFQWQTVVDFTRASCGAIKEVDAALETQLCVMPSEKFLFPRLCPIETLDVFAVDPYWIREINRLTLGDAVEVTRYAKQLADENGKKFEVYLGCFGIPSGREEDIYRGSKILIEASSPFRATTWSFRGGLGLTPGFKDGRGRMVCDEECERPEIAWQSIVRLYEELSAAAAPVESETIYA